MEARVERARFPAGDDRYRTRMLTLADGVRVRVVEIGDPGAPPVLFVHGWACPAYVFRRNLPAVAALGFRAIVPEMRGHGHSDKPVDERACTLSAMTDHVESIALALHIDRAPVIGHSMGGAIALELAARRPDLVPRVCVLASVGFGPVPVVGPARVLTPRAVDMLLPYLSPRACAKAVLRLAYGGAPRFDEHDVDEYWLPTRQSGFMQTMRDLLHEFEWAPGTAERFGRVRQPVMAIVGTRDRFVRSGHAADYVRLLPHGRLEVIQGAGHVLPEEAFEAVNRLLAEFLAPEKSGTRTSSPPIP